MTPHVPTHRAASPKRKFFDPWNSASTGHQRAENRLSGSTSWRDSRNAKLNSQFAAGFASGGGKRMYDSVGAGSKDFGRDGRTDTGWDDSVRGWRGRQGIDDNQQDITDWMKRGCKIPCEPIPGKESTIQRLEKINEGTVCKRMELSDGKPAAVLTKPTRSTSFSDDDTSLPPSAQQPKPQSTPTHSASSSPSGNHVSVAEPPDTSKLNSTGNTDSPRSKLLPKIFANLTIFINGSTMPLISDHKLKSLLTNHGARMSIALGRRSVTHVILGKANSGVGRGAGGGLAGSKIEKEILRRGGSGNGIRYVNVEWVLESINAGKRLPESRFPGINLAPAGSKSVRSMLCK